MIILLGILVAVVLGSGDMSMWASQVDEARDRVEDAVADKGRRNRALAALDDIEVTTERNAMVTRAGLEKLDPVAARRTSTWSDYAAVLEPLAERRRSDKARLIELRFRLRDNLTREEWAKVFPPK